jgi:MFS family permease
MAPGIITQRARAASTVAVFGAALACFLAVGAVLPILPRYVHGPLGAGDVAVGVVIGAFAVTAIVARPWAGRETDRRGRRNVLAAGAVVMGVGGGLLFLPLDVPGVVLARLVVGIGEGVVFTAASAWVVDLAPPDRRGRIIGLFGLSVWGGMSAGPALGEGLHALAGYDAVWAFALLAPLAGAAIVLREPRDDVTRERPVGADPLFAREVIGPGIALALANAGYATMAGFVGLHLAHRGGGHGVIAFSAFAISIVATRLLLGRIPDVAGPRVAAVAAGLAECAGLAIVALASDWPLAVAGAIVMGVGFSLMYPALALFVVERVGEDRRGAALGSFTAFFDVGFGLGGPVAGAIAAVAGYPAAFWAAAVFALGTAAISSRLTAARPIS